MTPPRTLLVVAGPSLFDLGMAVMELIHFSAVRRRGIPPAEGAIEYAPGNSQLFFTLSTGELASPRLKVRCSEVLGIRRQHGGFDGLLLELVLFGGDCPAWFTGCRTLHFFYDAQRQRGFGSFNSSPWSYGQYYVTTDQSIGFKSKAGGHGRTIYDASTGKWHLDELTD